MKNQVISILIMPIFLINMSARASEDIDLSNLKETTNEQLINIVFDQMEEDGSLANVDAQSVRLARKIVETVVDDKELYQSYQDGTLVLDDGFIASYGLLDDLLDIAKKVVSEIKDITTSAIDVAKSVASKVLPIAKKGLQAFAKYSDVAVKTLASGVGNEILMTFIKVGDTLVPMLGKLGPLLSFIPVVGPVVNIALADVLPMVAKVITPTTVQTALNIAGKVTGAFNALANPSATKPMIAAALAPSMDSAMAVLEQKSNQQLYEEQIQEFTNLLKKQALFGQWPEDKQNRFIEINQGSNGNLLVRMAANLKDWKVNGVSVGVNRINFMREAVKQKIQSNNVKIGQVAQGAVNGGKALMAYVAKLSPAERSKVPNQIWTAIEKTRKFITNLANK